MHTLGVVCIYKFIMVYTIMLSPQPHRTIIIAFGALQGPYEFGFLHASRVNPPLLCNSSHFLQFHCLSPFRQLLGAIRYLLTMFSSAMDMSASLYRFIIADSRVEADCFFNGDLAIFIFVVNAARMEIFKA